MWTFIGVAILCLSAVAVMAYMAYDFTKSFRETKDYLELAIVTTCGLAALYFLAVALVNIYLACHGNPQTEPPH